MPLNSSPTAAANAALAKAPPLPLFIALADGNIYAWRNPGLSRKTTSSNAFNPTVSPDAQWLVYMSVAKFFLHQPSEITDQYTAPQDIFLLNVATNRTIPLASQSPKASFKEGARVYTLRSTPSWYPDSSQLAWTEITTNQATGTNIDLQTEQLVVYDIKSKKTHVIVSNLASHIFTGNNPDVSTVAWGAGGIAVSIIQPGARSLSVFVYDARGTLLSQSGDVTAPAFLISQLIWVKSGDKDYISSVGGGALIDPLTGEILKLIGQPEMYNPAAPDGYHISYSASAPDEGNTNWQATLNGQVVFDLAAVQIATIWDAAISPDGKHVAYIDFIAEGQGQTGAAFYFKDINTDIAPIDATKGTFQLAWSAPAWRILYPPSAFF